jgi:hypothetical protein
MAITRMRFVQEAELGRAAPTRASARVTGVRNAPRCNVDAAPEAGSMATKRAGFNFSVACNFLFVSKWPLWVESHRP